MTESVPKKDREVQAARAKRLQEEIETLTSPDTSPEKSFGSTEPGAVPGAEEENKPAPPLSPREFIQKRLAELDAEENKQKKRKPAARQSAPAKAKGKSTKSSKSPESSPARKKTKA